MINSRHNFLGKVCGFLLLVYFLGANYATAQDSTKVKREPGIYFPSPMYNNKWKFTIGFISTSTPEDITEEVRVRAPAGDWHILRKLNSHFNLDGRVQFQIIQNHFSLGFKYAKQLNDHFYFSVGDDVAFWFGKLKVGGFDSKGTGWMNYPNISLGFKTDRKILFTVKTEAIINTNYVFSNGGYEIARDANFMNGFAYSFFIEQPFYNKKHLTLGFSAIYTDFYWQMWSLFETFERRIFYPQITVGFIL